MGTSVIGRENVPQKDILGFPVIAANMVTLHINFKTLQYLNERKKPYSLVFNLIDDGLLENCEINLQSIIVNI